MLDLYELVYEYDAYCDEEPLLGNTTQGAS